MNAGADSFIGLAQTPPPGKLAQLPANTSGVAWFDKTVRHYEDNLACCITDM